MNTTLLDYEIPERLIAQFPTAKREESRLLLVDRQSAKLSHHPFRELPALLQQGSALFRNNARVLKGRLRGVRPSGGAVECLLLRPGRSKNCWWCLLRPGRKMRPGKTFSLEGAFRAEVLDKASSGEYLVGFVLQKQDDVISMAERWGEMPLPPYVKRSLGRDLETSDTDRYQTVYCDPTKTVAAAAPTAGLHFSIPLLRELEKKGIPSYDLTLHIGVATFQPITAERVEDHPMHLESYEIPKVTLEALRRNCSHPNVAVGTTTVRALEDFSIAAQDRTSSSTTGEIGDSLFSDASLLIYPPFQFQLCQALLTNFHLPRSTLMCLVAAFLAPGSTEGIKWLKEIYRQAIVMKYRFYSYGDAMLIL